MPIKLLRFGTAGDEAVPLIKKMIEELEAALGVKDEEWVVQIADYKNDGFTVKIFANIETGTQRGRGRISINRTILPPSSAPPNGRIVHDLFTLDPKFQGRGLTKPVMRFTKAIAAALRIKEVKVHANIDKGGWQWLWKGFLPKTYGRPLWSELDMMVRRRGVVSRADADAWTLRTKGLSDAEIKAFLRSEEFKQWEPRLRHIDWEGYADLTDPEVRQRLFGDAPPPPKAAPVVPPPRPSALDVQVRHQVYLERLKAGIVPSMDDAIRRMDVAIGNALAAAQQGRWAGRANLLRQLAALRTELGTIAADESQRLLALLRRLSSVEADFAAQALGVQLSSRPILLTGLRGLSATAAWLAVQAAPVQATGEMLEPFVRGWATSAMKKIEGAIQVGFAQGQDMNTILQAIRGTRANRFMDGILGGSAKREASAVARTAVQHVANAAHMAVYGQNEDIVDGYIWISTLDRRTSSICKSLDGRTFEVGKGPVPPAHVNCRSTTIPKIDGIDLLSETTRASADGQVAATTTYYDWLKKQSAGFQDDALGVTRGRLFRRGGLSSEEFAQLNLDKNFEPLTLDEMRQKNPRAFERAGV